MCGRADDPTQYDIEDDDDGLIECSTCGSVDTTEISDEKQSITICARCGSDQR